VRLPVPPVPLLHLLPHLPYSGPPRPIAVGGVESEQSEHDDVRRRVRRQRVGGRVAHLPRPFHCLAAATTPAAGHRPQGLDVGEEGQGVRRAGFGLSPGIGERQASSGAGEDLEPEDASVPVSARRC
jgi:hypothetical protein